MLEIKIETEYIKLDQFLKFAGLVNTGGEAKNIIAEGKVMVNGEVETARGKKLRIDDVIEIDGRKYKIV
ncbi:S4 domain-containing protein YaaA [Lutispora thermophila]|uniref:Ribosome-associated protein n=1 Tax=Lutispora thermophila DSM 19022 TaxID=1122184 RepID=A0A1M6HZ72_9FIRM|nr:S4 domain-containing protein YaaA [Lutispora thermophila]SHJ27538.1 ribosome-associated protein [Lutispora thermophila DSM 19022]